MFFTTIVETVVVVVVGEARVVMIERVVVVAADVVVDEVVVMRMRGRCRTTGLLPSPVPASTGLESGLNLCLFLARDTIKTSWSIASKQECRKGRGWGPCLMNIGDVKFQRSRFDALVWAPGP